MLNKLTWTVVVVVAVASIAWMECTDCKGKGRVSCSDCHGKWKNVTYQAPCKRADGGCDETGYRKCKQCAGEGVVKCSKCNGDGQISVKVGEKEGPVFSTPVFEKQTCPMCRGGGKSDCTKCKPLYECTKCGHWWESRVDYCPDCRSATSGGNNTGPSTITVLEGREVCPKCKGKRTYEKQGICPKCEKGTVVCPTCGGKK